MSSYENLTDKELCAERMASPEIGDYFHEWFAHHVFVLDVTKGSIVYATAQAPCDVPRDATLVTSTLEAFRYRYSYKATGGKRHGYWINYSDKVDVDGWLEYLTGTPDSLPVSGPPGEDGS